MISYYVFCVLVVGALARRHHQWDQAEPFMKNVTKDARREFDSIIRNDSLSRREMKMKVNAWALKQGEEIAKQVTDLQSERDQWFADARKNRTRIVEDLPEALKKWEDIKADEDLTRAERRNKTDALLESFDDETASILRYIVRTVPSNNKMWKKVERRRNWRKKNHRKSHSSEMMDKQTQTETNETKPSDKPKSVSEETDA